MAMISMGDIPRFHADHKRSDAVAVNYLNATLRWADLEARANRRARFYMAHGVGLDDRVAIALSNTTDFHETAFALWKLGATPALLSPRSPPHELRSLTDLMQSKLLVCDHEVAAQLEIPCVSGDADTSAYSEAPIEGRVARYWKAVCSGGSTGQPKVIVDHGLGAFDPLTGAIHEEFKMRPNGIILNPGPLYHNAPFVFSSYALFTGSTVVGVNRFDAEETLRLIEAHRVNWVCLVPTMMHRIWSLPRSVRERYDLSSLDAVWHMAAPCAPWLKEAWINWLGPERIWELYSATEGYGRTLIRGDDWLAHPGSVGRPVGGAQLKAMRDDGRDCPPGEIGELYFLPNGDNPSHYLGGEAKRTPSGWFSMGDLGHIDQDGYAYLADRRTDLILRGGANVYPAEIEGELDRYPGVASAIVLGLPSEELGARVHAIVELKDGVPGDAAAIHAFLALRLAKYKLPESYEFSQTTLRDDAGKARRTRLRDERIEWLQSKRPFQTFLAR